MTNQAQLQKIDSTKDFFITLATASMVWLRYVVKLEREEKRETIIKDDDARQEMRSCRRTAAAVDDACFVTPRDEERP